MFLEIRGIDRCLECEDFGRQLRSYVLTCTGLTVRAGIGPTKTLAKPAQWASKEWSHFRGMLALTPGNHWRAENLLATDSDRQRSERGSTKEPDLKGKKRRSSV